MNRQRWAALMLGLALAATGAGAVVPQGAAADEAVAAGDVRQVSAVAPLPSRVRIALPSGRLYRLDVRVLGLQTVRLTAIRVPEGFRIRRGRVADVVVGRVEPGKQVLVVWARRVGAASTTRRRVHIVIIGRGPSARQGTVLVSRGVDGEPADGESWDPLVSGDGDTVLFTSSATNLVRKRLPDGAHLFAWDRRTRRTELVGVLPDGSAALASATDVSQDGRFVLFSTDASHRWERDREKGTTVAVDPAAQLTPVGRLVTYPGLPPGWLPTAASEDGRYLGLQGPVYAGCSSPYGGQVSIAVWDSVTGATVHQTQIGCGEGVIGGLQSLTDDGGLGLLRWQVYRPDEINGDVMDMTTGALLIPDALDISGDARRLLTRVRRSGITLTDRASGDTVRLVKPYVSPIEDLGGLFTTASMARDGSDVAYSHDGDDLLQGVQSRFSQVYLWHDRSAERAR